MSWRARQSKLDRLHRVLSVQQSTIADLKGALASATQDNAAISAEIESLRASFANQTEDLKALHSQLTFANAQIDSYRSLADKRLTSMQFAFGIADDLQLQREEAWLLAEANAREISNLNAGIAEERDHIRDLEREMGAMNQAVLRASEYIKRLQQSGARANADISATVSVHIHQMYAMFCNCLGLHRVTDFLSSVYFILADIEP